MDEKTAQKLCVIYLLHFLIKIHIASCCITNKYLKIECVRHDYIVNNYCSEKANLPYNVHVYVQRNANICSRSQAQNKFVSASGAQRHRVDKQNSSNQRVDTLELVKQ